MRYKIQNYKTQNTKSWEFEVRLEKRYEIQNTKLQDTKYKKLRIGSQSRLEKKQAAASRLRIFTPLHFLFQNNKKRRKHKPEIQKMKYKYEHLNTNTPNAWCTEFGNRWLTYAPAVAFIFTDRSFLHFVKSKN